MFLEKIVRQMEEAEQAEAEAKWKVRYTAEGQREGQRLAVIAALEGRFGTVPLELVAAVNSLNDEHRLLQLVRTAVTCSDLAAFETELTNTP